MAAAGAISFIRKAGRIIPIMRKSGAGQAVRAAKRSSGLKKDVKRLSHSKGKSGIAREVYNRKKRSLGKINKFQSRQYSSLKSSIANQRPKTLIEGMVLTAGVGGVAAAALPNKPKKRRKK